MTTDSQGRQPEPSDKDSLNRGLPVGYRQGVITAITVMLGFSLYFLRFWNFEATGTWTTSAVIAAALMVISVLLQLIALWRSLQVEDDFEPVYRRTLQWFLAGIVSSGLGVLVASFAA